MRERSINKYRPGLERLEEKQLLSAGATAPVAHPRVAALQAAAAAHASATANAQNTISAQANRPHYGFLVYRITQPNSHNNHLTGPFGHVLVQARQPVPGQTYNVLQVAVRNGTAQTFDASSGLEVAFPGQRTRTPILTGNETWKPGQEFIFYVLTKKYYPFKNQVTDGFQFFLGGAESTAIPGPSGIFLRLKYNPATINKVLDWIVTKGPGAEGGKGIRTGIADTAIYEFVSAKTNKDDFGGYF